MNSIEKLKLSRELTSIRDALKKGIADVRERLLKAKRLMEIRSILGATGIEAEVGNVVDDFLHGENAVKDEKEWRYEWDRPGMGSDYWYEPRITKVRTRAERIEAQFDDYLQKELEKGLPENPEVRRLTQERLMDWMQHIVFDMEKGEYSDEKAKENLSFNIARYLNNHPETYELLLEEEGTLEDVSAKAVKACSRVVALQKAFNEKEWYTPDSKEERVQAAEKLRATVYDILKNGTIEGKDKESIDDEIIRAEIDSNLETSNALNATADAKMKWRAEKAGVLYGVRDVKLSDLLAKGKLWEKGKISRTYLNIAQVGKATGWTIKSNRKTVKSIVDPKGVELSEDDANELFRRISEDAFFDNKRQTLNNKDELEKYLGVNIIDDLKENPDKAPKAVGFDKYLFPDVKVPIPEGYVRIIDWTDVLIQDKQRKQKRPVEKPYGFSFKITKETEKAFIVSYGDKEEHFDGNEPTEVISAAFPKSVSIAQGDFVVAVKQWFAEKEDLPYTARGTGDTAGEPTDENAADKAVLQQVIDGSHPKINDRALEDELKPIIERAEKSGDKDYLALVDKALKAWEKIAKDAVKAYQKGNE